MKGFYILLFPLLIFACKKNKIEGGNGRLPIATERGRGMFACYIGDQTYVAKRQDAVTYNKNTGYLFLENANEDFEFRLFIYSGLLSEGDYQFDDTGEEWISSDYVDRYGIIPGGLNQIEITKLDLKKQVVAGRFNVDFVNENGVEKMVRNGRFDLEMEIIE
jgi:hypothetical protein